MGAKPPALSPYIVVYPTAISDLLPVDKRRALSVLEMPISNTARILACRFSPAKSLNWSADSKALWTGSMGIFRSSIERLAASFSASVIE